MLPSEGKIWKTHDKSGEHVREVKFSAVSGFPIIATLILLTFLPSCHGYSFFSFMQVYLKTLLTLFVTVISRYILNILPLSYKQMLKILKDFIKY